MNSPTTQIDPSRAANPTAIFGAATTAFSTLVALAFIPERFEESGSLRVSAIAQTIGLLLPIGITAYRRTKDLFRSENGLIVGILYWIELDLLQGYNEPVGVSLAAVQLSFLGIGLLACGVWAGVAFRAWPLPRSLRRAAMTRLPGNAALLATMVCFALAMTNYLVACDFNFDVLTTALMSKSRWSAPWAPGRLGGWSAFREHLAYFGYLVPTLTVLTAGVRGWVSIETGIGLTMSAIILLFASQGGGRGEVGVIVNAALICWLLQRPRIGLWDIARAAGAVAVLLIWMQVMVAFRNDGWLAVALGSATGENEANFNRIDVDDNFYRLCQVVDLIPAHISHTYGGQLWYVLVRPIPRALWPDKPVGPGFTFEHYTIGNEATTLSVSIIGELYFDFGLPFVLVGGIFLGRLAGVWDQLLDIRQGGVWPVLYGLGAMALFVAIRSEQGFLVRTYPILFWLVLSAFLFQPTRLSGEHGSVT